MTADETQQPSLSAKLPAPRRGLFLLYHELTQEPSAYGYALSTDTFREHVRLVQRLQTHPAEGLLPSVTFDDGHLSNFTQALPLLTDFSLKGHFFITAGWTGNRPEYMSWDQLRQLQAAGQRIGAHGWSHKLLTHCSAVELDTELKQAKSLLEDRLGTPVTTISLPGGRFNQRVLAACAEAGYAQVFTSIPRAESALDARLLGRLNIRTGATQEWLLSALDPQGETLRKMERQYRLKAAVQRGLGDSLYLKLWSLVNRADAGEA